MGRGQSTQAERRMLFFSSTFLSVWWEAGTHYCIYTVASWLHGTTTHNTAVMKAIHITYNTACTPSPSSFI
jgi:hypothetical protein